MAEEKYRSANCVDCGESFAFEVSKRGRPRVRCIKCSPQQLGQPNAYVKKTKVEMRCVTCGGIFKSGMSWQRYCSEACSGKPFYAKNQVSRKCERCGIDYVIDDKRRRWCSKECANASQPLQVLPCKVCLKPFKQKLPYAVYCSKPCKQKAFHSRKPGAQQAKARRAAAAVLAAEREALKHARSLKREAARLQRQIAKRAWAERSCKECGQTITRARARAFCSAECSNSAHRRSQSVVAAKKLRKQLKRGANGGELFSDFDIFERDGWRCQICNVSTPKQHHASNKWTAPELDHIVPVTRGGTHTRDNVQCLCRRCNNKKSNGPPAGQIGLFTGLLNEQIKTGRRRRQPATT